MNPRIVTAAVGAIMLLLGLAGLFYPDAVMGMLGYQVMSTSRTAGVLGEVRATYGGLFIAAGAYTIWAATDPGRNRSLIFFAALLWLGAAGGRIFGAMVDGNPGLVGLFAIVFELGCGGALLYAWQGAGGSPAAQAAPHFGT